MANLAGCPNAKNTYHKCNAYCKQKLLQQEQLYGAAVADAAAEGVEQYADTRWRRRAAVQVPGAVPIARVQRLDAAQTTARHLTDGGSPVIVTDAQDGWKARQLWSFGYLREHFGEEHVFCTDRAPSRKKDEPAGQTLRVRLADFADYCMGTAELPSYLNDYERGDAPGLPTRPFALLGWSPFYEHRTLAAHFERPAFAPDATPEVRGQSQVVLYAPGDTNNIYGHEQQPRQSPVDPLALDLAAYPSVRAATAHVAVLDEGETLLVPAGWWQSTVCLDRCVSLQRHFVDAASVPAFTAVSAVSAASPSAAVGGVEAATTAGGGGEAEAEAGATASGTGYEGGISSRRADDGRSAADDVTRDIYVRAEEYKALGNRHFARGLYREATEAYTNAIECIGDEVDWQEASSRSGNLAVYYSNRAACWLKRKQFQKAIDDCSEVLRSGRCDGVAVKALFRRAKGLEGVGDLEGATRDLKTVAEIQPHNRDALKELDLYRSPLHRIMILGNGTQEMRMRQRGGM